MRFLFALLSIVLLAGGAIGVNSVEQEFTCPIDGHVWKQRIETSAKARGLRLDLRQLGDVVDPPTLPQCPNCSFPMFSDHLPEALVAHLKPFVMGQDFQFLARKHPSYFALAQVQEYLVAPERNVALSYLRASWQVEERAALNLRLLEKAREHFEIALRAADERDRQVAELALLCGEIERRLEKWEAAAKRFRKLEASGRLNGTPQAPIVAFQLSLIERRDSTPQALDGSAVAQVRRSADGGGIARQPQSLWEASGAGDGQQGGFRLGVPAKAPEVPARPPEFPARLADPNELALPER